MKAKIYIGAKKYALYIGRKIVQNTLEFLTLPAMFVSKKVQELKDYLVYGQSVQNGTPTPTTPIEVESVGDKTKNLFDPKILVQGNYSSSANTRIYGKLDLKDNINYTISITGYYEMFVNFFNKGTTTSGGNLGSWFKNKVTISSDKIDTDLYDYILIIRNYSNTTLLLKDFDGNIQLEEGTTATPYEPYGYKVPVVVGGKNLFDKVNAPVGGYLGANGTFNSGINTKHIDFLEIPQGVNRVSRFTKDYVSTDSNYLTHIGLYDENKIPISVMTSFGNGANAVVVIPDNAKYIQCSIGNKDVEGTVIYWGGEQISEYVPYIEPTTTNIYLSEPLRKVGEYADYIDFEGQKVVRNVREVEFSKLGIGVYEEQYRRYSVQGIDDRLPVAIRTGNGFSTAFKLWNTGGGAGSVANNYFYWGESQSMYIVEDVIKNNLQMKQLLTEQYIYYPLATPIEEQITLPTINLEQGTLTIDTDTKIKPSKISITGDIDNE